MVSRFVIAVVAAIAWIVTSMIAMSHGTLLNWPDFVHVIYGFPFTFATHTLNTIVGPVDKWGVDMIALVVDMVFWLSGLIVIFGISEYYQKK
ncbi:MAG: hypothetical protein JRN20_22000 [Nitrososphaerota archaeon]|nr:hypothetical protein [Nitrososphaerota archaeon]